MRCPSNRGGAHIDVRRSYSRWDRRAARAPGMAPTPSPLVPFAPSPLRLIARPRARQRPLVAFFPARKLRCRMGGRGWLSVSGSGSGDVIARLGRATTGLPGVSFLGSSNWLSLLFSVKVFGFGGKKVRLRYAEFAGGSG